MLIFFIFISSWLLFVVILTILKLVPGLYLAFIYTLFSMVCSTFMFLAIVCLRKYFFANKSLKINYLEFLLCAYYSDCKVDSWKVCVYIPTVSVFVISSKSGDVIHFESLLSCDQYLYFIKKVSGKVLFIKEKALVKPIFEKGYYDYSELPSEVIVFIKFLKNFIEGILINTSVQNEVIINPHLYCLKVERILIY